MEAAGAIDTSAASLAFQDVISLELVLCPCAPFAERAWELRHNLTLYDAWYVAVAEALELPLATLDRRLAHAPASSCGVLVPPAAGAG
jgi:predicted nucleic acid-binding protein